MTIKKLKKYKELANPQIRPRYHGLATFMRAPFTEDFSEVDIALVGVPFDGGVTNRPGARHGPREVRNQSSLMRVFNQATGANPYTGLSVRDVGDAWVEQPFELEGALAEIAEFFGEIGRAGIMPISCGGDHSVTLPILRGIARAAPVGLVHFDAHCDTGDDYLGSKFHHGAPFRRAVEEGLVDPKRTIQIGIRGGINDPKIWAFSHDSGMRVVYMEEFHDKGWRWAAEEACRVAGTGPVYVTFDVDGLDPVYAPGTGTPEAGGITMVEAQRMIRMLKDLDIVGGDVVEVAPPFDPSGTTALNGATLMFEILCVAAEALRRRKAG